MHHFEVKDGVLHAEGVSVEALAREYGTPLYVYSHATLTRHIRVLKDAFAGIDHMIAYAVKANPNLAVIRTLAAEGAGADIVSGGELERALRAGVPPERIVFSGVGKTAAEIEAAVSAGILCFNIEVEGELSLISEIATRLGRTARVSVRVNPDVDAGTHEYIATGKSVNKFGIPYAQAPALYERARKAEGVEVTGVDCHIGSQLVRTEPFVEALGRIRSLVEDLRESGIRIDHIDVGGGLGVRYRDEEPPSPEEYAEAVRSQIGDLGVRVILEPGRVIVANAGILVTRVLYRKQIEGKNFVIVDAAMNDLLRPALYGAYHEVEAVEKGSGVTVVADVVGPVCETGDFLAREQVVPDAQPGELVALMSCGAYGRSMSSNYNTRTRAAEVLVHGDAAYLVHERETVEHVLALERIPSFLGAS